MNTLALSYIPPLQRDLVDPTRRPTFNHVDCGEMRDHDYGISIYRAHRDGDFRRPAVPLINVLTTPEIEWIEGGADYELWQTSIWFFHNRASFKAAYRLARILRKQDGEATILRRDLHLFAAIEVALNHNVEVLDGEFVFKAA